MQAFLPNPTISPPMLLIKRPRSMRIRFRHKVQVPLLHLVRWHVLCRMQITFGNEEQLSSTMSKSTMRTVKAWVLCQYKVRSDSGRVDFRNAEQAFGTESCDTY
jgi:hypothetical protein